MFAKECALTKLVCHFKRTFLMWVSNCHNRFLWVSEILRYLKELHKLFGSVSKSRPAGNELTFEKSWFCYTRRRWFWKQANCIEFVHIINKQVIPLLNSVNYALKSWKLLRNLTSSPEESGVVTNVYYLTLTKYIKRKCALKKKMICRSVDRYKYQNTYISY